jgi:hypothetical protein
MAPPTESVYTAPPPPESTTFYSAPAPVYPPLQQIEFAPQEVLVNLIPYVNENDKCSGPILKYLLPSDFPISQRGGLFVNDDLSINVCRKSGDESKFLIFKKM